MRPTHEGCRINLQDKHRLTTRKLSSGGAAWSLVKLILLLAIVSAVFSSGGSCVKQLPELAGQAAGEIAGGVASLAGSAASDAWRRNVTWPLRRGWNRFVGWLSDLVGSGKDLWSNTSAPDKFKLVCENLPVDGVSDLCKYFEAPLRAATDAQTERIACLWQAASGRGGTEVRRIADACVVNKNDPDELESCLKRQIEPGDRAQCLASAPGQFWKQAAQTIKPLACPEIGGVLVPGTPESCRTTPQVTQNPANVRIDQPYINCLTAVYNQQITGRLPAQQSCLDQQAPSMQHWVQCLESVLVARLPGTGATAVAQCGNVR